MIIWTGHIKPNPLEEIWALNLPLKIIHPSIKYEHKPKQDFIDSQIRQAKKNFLDHGLDFEIIANAF